MKRLLLVTACVLLLAGPASAVTFDTIQLDSIWFTVPGVTIRYALGVSSTPGGTLLNSAGGLSLAEGNVYYLYADNIVEPSTVIGDWTPGSAHHLHIWTDYTNLGGASPMIFVQNFSVVGNPGTLQAWTSGPQTPLNNFVPPVPTIYLGWAQGTANLVGDTSHYYADPNGMWQPDDSSDLYLVMGIGVNPFAPNPIPLPGAVWLLGSGLLGLGGISRWRRNHS
jgi:hypothetical protein